MKKLLLSIVTTGIMVVSSAASANGMMSEDKLQALCVAAQSNNKVHLINEMKKQRVRFNQLQKGLVCNGLDVVSFAKYHGADKTAELISSKTNLDADVLLSKR